MYVEFEKDHANFKKGDVANVAPEFARLLVGLGVAKVVDPPEADKPKPKASAKK